MLKKRDHFLDRHIIALAAGPDGIAVKDITYPGRSSKSIGMSVNRLANEGVIFRAKIAHKKVNYFSTEGARDNCLRKYASTSAASDAVRVKSARAWWPADAEPYFPENYVHTVAPAPSYTPMRTNTYGLWS